MRRLKSILSRVGIRSRAGEPAGPRVMDPGITDDMSEEEKFYRRTLWTVDWEYWAKQPKEPFVPPTAEERADIERYLGQPAGRMTDGQIRDIIDSGL